MSKNSNKKVVVGLSGGVDSSVAAALLKDQGYEVVGVFIHFWSEKIKGRYRDNVCCSLESKNDAKKVAKQLGIKFYSFDMKIPFKEKIVDDFVCSYKAGRTPNPCVLCNKHIKFGEFIKKAKLLGADYVATGHYARIRKLKDEFQLLKGKDKEKDQSYFLHKLNQKQLSQILFPLGNYTKDQTRKLAKKYKLSVQSKKESQEVCFIPDGDIKKFLSRNLELRDGDIKDLKTKEVLGRHLGLPVYTIGQRKRIGLPGGPWYVVKLDKRNNVLWASKDEKDIMAKELKVHNFHWISGQKLKLPIKVKAQIRYRSKAEIATIKVEKTQNTIIVQFNKPQRAITPGQYFVAWKGQVCLGGGQIE